MLLLFSGGFTWGKKICLDRLDSNEMKIVGYLLYASCLGYSLVDRGGLESMLGLCF